MTRLVDVNGNSLPCNVQVNPGETLALYAVDDSNVPVSCLWSLNFRGGVNSTSSPVTGTTTGQFSNIDQLLALGYPGLGSLDGPVNTYRPQYSIGASTSTIYRAPVWGQSNSPNGQNTQLLPTVTLDLVIVATPVNGSPSRSIYLRLNITTPNY